MSLQSSLTTRNNHHGNTRLSQQQLSIVYLPHYKSPTALLDMHHLTCRISSFFIPSTSFCPLSSWFTSSCAYHLITVTTFALTIRSITPSTFHLRLKNPSLSQILSSIVFLVPFGKLHRSWTGTGLSGHWFLRTTACAIARICYRPSVCPSHGRISQKQLKLGMDHEIFTIQ